MAVVIDDRLLLEVLARAAPAAVTDELSDGAVFTTSCWYWRLGRAVTVGSGTGSLSGRLAALAAEDQDRVLWALQELPDRIGLLTSRTVVPVMLALRVRRPLNMLNAEALAVALLAQPRCSPPRTRPCSDPVPASSACRTSSSPDTTTDARTE
jgi:hypothetical protein